MSTLFNPRSPFAFLLAFIYAILATIGLFNPYKDFPTPDYPEGSLNYEYSLRKDGYDDWYGKTTLQGVLNMINARDKEGLMSKFAPIVKEKNDISRKIDILFGYIEGEIIDYDTTDECTSSYSVEYGHYHRYEIDAPTEIQTQKHSYQFCVTITIFNDDDRYIGINDIDVTRKDVVRYHMIMDIPFPDSVFCSGVTIYGFDGFIV